jgi:hypothetical protein
MTSKKYTITMLGVIVALTIAVGGGLTAIHADASQGTHATQMAHRTVISYRGIAGVSALAVLQQKYRVQTKTYSGIGQEVTGINGVLADSKHYWAFYINGKMAQVGAGSYITKTNDTITWKLESV